jgi:hypothetical protein
MLFCLRELGPGWRTDRGPGRGPLACRRHVFLASGFAGSVVLMRDAARLASCGSTPSILPLESPSMATE